jgi:hypothetical protein
MDIFESLNELSKLGKKTKEVSVGETKILLSTLDASQEGEVFIACAELSGNAYFYKLKTHTLTHSIKAVNGQRLDAYENIKEKDEREKLKKETLEKVSNILGTWDENVISFLYSKWSILSKESEDELKKKGLIID